MCVCASICTLSRTTRADRDIFSRVRQEARVGLRPGSAARPWSSSLPAAHQDLAVHDRGVHRAAVGREDQVRVDVRLVARHQGGEHRVWPCRPGSRRPCMPGVSWPVSCRSAADAVAGGHPDHGRGLHQAGVHPLGAVHQRGELHHLERVPAVVALGGVVAEADVDPGGEHLRQPGDPVAELGVRAGVVRDLGAASRASARSRCPTATRSARPRSPGRAARRRRPPRWAAGRTVPCSSPPRSATRSGGCGCRCPARRPGRGRRGAARGRPAAATRCRRTPRSGRRRGRARRRRRPCCPAGCPGCARAAPRRWTARPGCRCRARPGPGRAAAGTCR